MFDKPKSLNNDIQSHVFTYKVWKNSLLTTYITSCALIILVALYFQIELDDLLNRSERILELQAEVANLSSQVSSGTLSAEDQANTLTLLSQNSALLASKFHFSLILIKNSTYCCRL